MNNLKELLEFRRAVRYYSNQPIDPEVVKECLETARLAPTAYNMQLFEMYHITDKEMLKKFVPACLDQDSVATAQQLVVFVTRQDLHRKRAKAMLAHEIENVKRNSPPEKVEKRIKKWEADYNKLMPLLYARAWGLLGAFRKTLSLAVGLFRPMYRQTSENDMRIDVHRSCALAAQTFMLAMAEKGYDTCPMVGIDSLRIKKLLHLPYGAEINMVLSCGIREERGIWGDRYRLPMDELYKRI